jgi:hypothetical protein
LPASIRGIKVVLSNLSATFAIGECRGVESLSCDPRSRAALPIRNGNEG